MHSVCNYGEIFADNQTAEHKLLYTKIFNAIWNMDGALPSYIRNCFELFKISNKEIRLQLSEEGITDDIDYIIKYLLHQNDGCTVYDNNKIISETKDKSNLLQSQFICLFPNLEEIVIRCGKEDQFWQFSVHCLIKEIINSKRRNRLYVDLTAMWNKDKSRSWLFHVWKELSPDIVEIWNVKDNSHIMDARTKEYDFVKDTMDEERHNKYYVYNMMIEGQEIDMYLKGKREWWRTDWYDTDWLYFRMNCEPLS